MDRADGRKLKRYLRPAVGGLLLGIFFMVSAIVMICDELRLFFVFLVMAAITSWKSILALDGMVRQLREWRENGQLEQAVKEFDTGKQFLNDKIRLCKSYVIGKRSGRIIAYDEILRVYQYVHKTNFTEDRRELRADLTDGETIMICKLPVGGANSQELMQVVAMIKIMNPNVQIGYK